MRQRLAKLTPKFSQYPAVAKARPACESRLATAPEKRAPGTGVEYVFPFLPRLSPSVEINHESVFAGWNLAIKNSTMDCIYSRRGRPVSTKRPDSTNQLAHWMVSRNFTQCPSTRCASPSWKLVVFFAFNELHCNGFALYDSCSCFFPIHRPRSTVSLGMAVRPQRPITKGSYARSLVGL